MTDTAVPDNHAFILRLTLDKADAGQIAALAEAARAMQLEVLNQSARALTLSGTRQSIENTFKCQVTVKDDRPEFSTQPLFDNLPVQSGVRVYFPGQPLFF